MKIEKSRDIYRSRYLISQYEFLIQLYLITLFTKIKFLFDQTIIEKKRNMLNKIKGKKIYGAIHVRNIIQK